METRQERLREYYSNEELAELGGELSEHLAAVGSLKEEKSRYNKNITVEVEKEEASINDLSLRIRQRYFYNSVRCCVFRDFQEKEVYVVRSDNCEIVSVREMRADELQQPLPMEKSEDALLSIDEAIARYEETEDGEQVVFTIADSLLTGKWDLALEFQAWLDRYRYIYEFQNDGTARVSTLKLDTVYEAKKLEGKTK